MKFPTHIAIDTSDGTVFHRGADGKLFNEITASEFVDERNAALKRPTYRVFGVHYEKWRKRMKVVPDKNGNSYLINPSQIAFMEPYQGMGDEWYLRISTTGGIITVPVTDEQTALTIAAILDA